MAERAGFSTHERKLPRSLLPNPPHTSLPAALRSFCRKRQKLTRSAATPFPTKLALCGGPETRRVRSSFRIPPSFVTIANPPPNGDGFAMAERMGFEPMCACAQTDFECDALRPLFGNFLSEAVKYGSAKTRTAAGFFGGRIQKIALFRRFPKMGSNHEKLRFWAELGADGAEQRQNGNTRTAHRQFCYFEVYCK